MTQEQVMTVTADKLLTEKEAATFMNMSPMTLGVWRSTKRYPLRYVLLGGSIRYRMKDIEEFLAERTVDEWGTSPVGIKRRPGGKGRPRGWSPKGKKKAARKTATR